MSPEATSLRISRSWLERNPDASDEKRAAVHDRMTRAAARLIAGDPVSALIARVAAAQRIPVGEARELSADTAYAELVALGVMEAA